MQQGKKEKAKKKGAKETVGPPEEFHTFTLKIKRVK